MHNTLVKSNDVLIVRDSVYTFKAELGNVRNFFNPETDKTEKQVLLRYITSEGKEVYLENQWFLNKKLISLASKNMGKKVCFMARCKEVVFKDKGELQRCFVFTEIEQVYLTF